MSQNQHYVPQLYLRRFADPAGPKKGCPWVLDTPNGHLEQLPTKKICAEPDLHEFGSDLPSIEEIWSSAYETKAGQSLQALSTDGPLSDIARADLNFWLGSQFCRTLAYRDALMSTGSWPLKAMVRALANEEDLNAWWREFKEANRQMMTDKHGPSKAQHTIKNSISVLRGHFQNDRLVGGDNEAFWHHVAVAHSYFTWLFYHFEVRVLESVGGSFLTSDQPVTFDSEGLLGFSGPTLIYPIGPQRCLVGWRSAGANSENSTPIGTVVQADEAVTNTINAAQVRTHRPERVNESETPLRRI